MANTKISALTANTNPNWWEELVYAYNNANGKMTLNTMKTFVQNNLSWYATTADLAGKQDTLVSWTNIKTINNTSLLWNGNIDITWWTSYTAWTWISITSWTISNTWVTSVNGQTWDVTVSWGGGSAMYDCVVSADGTWDYTTIWAAIAAGKTSIFVKNWAYTESTWWNASSTGKLNLVWESKDWVVITIPNTATPASWSKFIDMGTWQYLYLTNLSFNISFTSSVKYLAYETEEMWFLVDNCNFTYSSTYQWAIIFYMSWVISCTSRASGLDTFSNHPESWIYWCKFYTETPNTYRIFIVRWDMYFERCLFQTWNSAWQIAFYWAWDRIFKQCTINAYTLYSKSDTFYTTYIEIFSWWWIEYWTDTVFYIEWMQDSRIDLPWTMSLKPNRISLWAMINSEATMYTLAASVWWATFNWISNVINSHVKSSNTIELNAWAYNSFFEWTVSCDVAVPFVWNRVSDWANFWSIGAIIMWNVFGNEFDVAWDTNIIVWNQMVWAIVDTGTWNVKANNINS